MKCQTLEGDLVDLARDQTMDASRRQAVLLHLEKCRVCAERFSHQQMLTRGLQALARSTATEGAPERLGENLRHAFRQQQTSRPKFRRTAAWLAGAAAAAFLLLLASGERFLSRLPPPVSNEQQQPTAVARVAPATPDTQPPTVDTERPRRTATTQTSEAAANYFLLLDQGYPIEMGLVVRVKLPASILALTGGDLESSSAVEIQADVLLGEDGLARGIRLLPEIY